MNRRIWDRTLRLFLRSVPIIPGPELYDLVLDIRKSQNEFDEQVNEAVAALHSTSNLVTALQDQLSGRMKELQHLREEHARYSELAQIEASKAEALIKQVEMTLGREQKKERWIALLMHLSVGFLFFVLGVAVSDPFKNWLVRLWRHVVH
jgi:hypothetical protein